MRRWEAYRLVICRNCGHVANSHIVTMRGESWCLTKACRRSKACAGFCPAEHQSVSHD